MGRDDTLLMNLPPTVVDVQRRSPEPLSATGILQAGASRVDLTAAQDAFLSGRHTAAAVAAIVALAGAVVAMVLLPARDASEDTAAVPAGARELVPA